jgi:hypothetical protein
VLPRRRITVPPVQYTALVGRQDVIREVQGLGPESLTRLGWMCTVRSRRDWECDAPVYCDVSVAVRNNAELVTRSTARRRLSTRR